MSMICSSGTQWIWMSCRVVTWRDAAAIAVGDVGHDVQLLGGEQAARES